MLSKQNPSYDYAKPLLCSLALHGVLAILFYLSPHHTAPTITPSVTVTLVQPKTVRPHTQAQAISEAIKPNSTAKVQADVVKTINTSSPKNHQASIDPAINTQTEILQELTTDNPKAIDTATLELEQAKTDITTIGNSNVTNAIAEPIFDAAYLQNPKPSYPSFARSLQQQGIVKLRVKVSEQGLAEAIELAESSGFKLLDESAQKTVKSWRFVPAKQGTKAISAWVIVPIHFQLS